MDQKELRDAALIVIDMQNGFCHPEGSVAKAMDIEDNLAVIPVIGRLVDAAHEWGLPVFWVTQEHLADDRSIDRSRLKNPQTELSLPPCVRGSWDAELVDELRERVTPDDVRIVKHRASGFYGTGLEVDLRMRGIREVLICGVSSSYCVDGTARDACSRDLRVTVIEDGCASPWRDLHEATMKNVSIFLGTVESSDSILKAIQTTKN